MAEGAPHFAIVALQFNNTLEVLDRLLVIFFDPGDASDLNQTR